jgi:hypothetical protein
MLQETAARQQAQARAAEEEKRAEALEQQLRQSKGEAEELHLANAALREQLALAKEEMYLLNIPGWRGTVEETMRKLEEVSDGRIDILLQYVRQELVPRNVVVPEVNVRQLLRVFHPDKNRGRPAVWQELCEAVCKAISGMQEHRAWACMEVEVVVVE